MQVHEIKKILQMLVVEKLKRKVNKKLYTFHISTIRIEIKSK